MCRWRFKELERADENADPTQGEFFIPEGIVDALVRESDQNSLDARAPGRSEEQCVRMRIAFSGNGNGVPREKAEPYLAGLACHLEALGQQLPDTGTVPFLVIEDFGTVGLTGDPEQAHDRPRQPGEDPNRFYYFWRNIGRSDKTATERGRWGLGKTVFSAASLINAYFGYTVRGDGRHLLMGKAILKIHEIAGRHYTPYGYFARFDSEDGFQIPIKDQEQISEFRKLFGLKRTDEPGLSVIVPYPDTSELDLDALARSTIKHYFYPIAAGELEVHIEDGQRECQITAANLNGIIDELDWTGSGTSAEELRRLVELSLWYLERSDGSVEELAGQDPGHAPKWSSELIADDQHGRLVNAFEAGDPICVRVPVSVLPKDGDPVDTAFDIVLQRDTDLRRGVDRHIRKDIWISGVSSVGSHPVRALLIVRDKTLSEFLGDAENPAHTEWQERSRLVKEKYFTGASRVRFVKNAIGELVGLLTPAREGEDRDLLVDFFSIPDEGAGGDQGTDGARRRRRGRSRRSKVTIKRRSKPSFQIAKRADGFRVMSPLEPGPPVAAIQVDVAYESSGGDPFRRYDPFDFALEDLPVATENATIIQREGNRLEFRIDSSPFHVDVGGFDTEHRDLRVNARKMEIES